MRALAYVLMGVLGGMGLMVFFQDMGENSSLVTPISYAMAAPETEDPKPWNSKDLLEMSTIYDHQADELQSEATRLEQRAISLAQKPHMDPKGFHRTGLMHISASRWKAARELRELATMHREEGQRLLAFEKSDGNHS
jgi:hypothetical protein